MNHCLRYNLKQFRKCNELSIQKMADFLGVKHRATYYSWETGVAEPNIKMLLTISFKMRVSVDDLLKRNQTIETLTQ